MNIPLDLNVGDTVFIWRFGEIRPETVRKIHVVLTHDEPNRIRYETEKYTLLPPEELGKYWFRSRQDAVEFVQRTVICGAPVTPCPEPPSEGLVSLKDKLLKKLWG